MAYKDYKDEIVGGDGYKWFSIVDEAGNVIYPKVRSVKNYTPEQEGTSFGADDILNMEARTVKFEDGTEMKIAASVTGGLAIYCDEVGFLTKAGAYNRISAKALRLYVSGGSAEGLVTTSGAGTGGQLALACNAGSCASTLAGDVYNNFRAANLPSSSERYKENIREMTDEEAEQILNFIAVEFDWKEGSGFSGKSYSFIAERLAEIDERFVYKNGDGEVEGILTNPILAAQNHVIKKQAARIADLEKRIETLEKKVG